jgi:methyltransferase
VTPAELVLGFVTLQRGAELALAHRNTSRLLARGAVEAGARHYPAIVLLHAAWLVGLWLLGHDAAVSLAWLAAFVLLQLLRVWVIASLGEGWTTRIIVLRDAPLRRIGPYRFLSHPNYLVVAGEIAVLPLTLGLPWYALGFSLANAGILAIRIRAENAALASALPSSLARPSPASAVKVPVAVGGGRMRGVDAERTPSPCASTSSDRVRGPRNLLTQRREKEGSP